MNTIEARKIAERLDMLRSSVHGNVYRRAMEDAADAIRVLTRNPLKLDPDHKADCAQVHWHNHPDGPEVRVVLYAANKEPKAYVAFDSMGAYDLASSLLHAYDKLEGL